MSAPLTGRKVKICGLTARPELNGQVGIAVAYNDATGRYNISLERSGGFVALKAVNVLPATYDEPRTNTPSSSGGEGTRGAGLRERATTLAAQVSQWADRLFLGINPQHVAMAICAVLVFCFGFSLLNAALLCAVGYLAHSAAKREGGLLPAARSLSARLARVIQRFTGHNMSQAQAAFLVIAVLFLVWKFWLSDSTHASGARSSGYSAGSGRSHRESSGYDQRDGFSSSHRRARYGDDYNFLGGYGSGWGSGWDLSFMISAGMLATMVYQLGGGRNGWSLAELIHRVQNMDFWQMMMFANLLQSVLGGRGRGYGGMHRYARRGMYF